MSQEMIVKEGRKTKFNHEMVLGHMISEHTRGGDISWALNEVVNNSFDAQANQCRIMLGDHEGKPAVIIMDDGAGFNEEGIISVLSYGYSSRDRKDTKTAGVNGTGTKSLLALGRLNETKVTIYTRSNKYPTGVGVSFDYTYLMDLIKAPQEVKNLTRYFENKGLFYKGWKRERGSTIILTGFDPKLIASNQSLIEALARRISPRAAKKVLIQKSGDFAPLKSVTIEGEFYSMDFDHSNLLGHVTFDIYYGGPNTGPMICGQENSILEFGTFFSKVPLVERKRMTKIWGSIGGHVYIPNANVFRMHDGSFSDEFYETGACRELMTMFEMVAGDLEKSHEKNENEKTVSEQMEILRIISLAGQVKGFGAPPKFPKGNKEPGIVTATHYGNINVPEFFIPSRVTVHRNSSVNVILQNLGTKDVNFRAAIWTPENKNIQVIGNGDRVTINAHNTLGSVSVKIKGAAWNHEITVNVVEKPVGAFIAGESPVNPGTTHEYFLNNWKEMHDVTWQIGDVIGVTLKPDKDPSKVTVSIATKSPAQHFNLFCTNGKGNIIAKKNIRITEHSTNRPFVTTVGEHHYVLAIAATHHTCAVQIEDAEEEQELPTIYVNPLHPQLRQASWSDAANTIAFGIAFCAVANQVEKGFVTSQKGVVYAWKFIEEKKAHLSAGKPKKK